MYERYRHESIPTSPQVRGDEVGLSEHPLLKVIYICMTVKEHVCPDTPPMRGEWGGWDPEDVMYVTNLHSPSHQPETDHQPLNGKRDAPNRDGTTLGSVMGYKYPAHHRRESFSRPGNPKCHRGMRQYTADPKRVV